MEKEIRKISNEIRTLEDSRVVEGYAAVYESESLDLGGFTEIIARGAFDDVIPISDVFATFNHNEDRILARSNHGKGSLELSLDERGLKYRFEAPKTNLGDELLAFLRTGDISESSFAFTVDSDSWVRKEDGTYLRTINKVNRLFDVSPVWNAAYGSATSVSCRSFDDFKAEEARLAEEKAKAESEEKAKQLRSYYSNLREENKDYFKSADNK